MFSLMRTFFTMKTIESNLLKHTFSSSKSQEIIDLTESFSRRRRNPKPVKKSAEERKEKLINSAENLGVPLFDKPKDDSFLCEEIIKINYKKGKERRKRIMIEGFRLISESIKSGFLPSSLFFSKIEDIKALDLPADKVNLHKIPYKLLSKWSDVVTSSGIIAFLDTPNIEVSPANSIPLTIICDNIRDPGNLGTILRTAAAASCRQVKLTKGCVDPWENKVLRSGAGAHFQIPIQKNYARNDPLLDADSLILFAENINLTSNDDNIKSQIPVVPYYNVDFKSKNSINLVIGGETQGISNQLLEEALPASPIRINIPLNSNTESLNSAIAMAILAFEIKKQLTKL